MRKLICYLFIFFGFKFSAQSQSIYATYDVVYNTTKITKRAGYLWANSEKSVFELDILTAIAKEEELEKMKTNKQDDTLRMTLKANIVDNYYYHTIADQNRLYFFDKLEPGKYVLISDNTSQKWELTKETKKIDEIICYKATTIFRGIEWHVWYAPSIPYPYGPWKLRGLPGLIIQANDVSKKYSYSVVSIEYSEGSEILDKDFKNLVSEEITNEMTMKEFIELKDELRESSLGEIRGRGSFLQSTMHKDKVRYGRELIYEWEEEK